MHYLDNFRTLIKLYKAFEGSNLKCDISIRYNHLYWKWNTNSHDLELQNDGFLMGMNRRLVKNNGVKNTNFIAMTTKRVYATFDNIEYKTALYNPQVGTITVPTNELITEEGYFQNSLLGEIPAEIEEIQQVYQGVMECYQNGIRYNGSYRGKLINPIPLIKRITNEYGNIEYWRGLYEKL